MEWSHRFPVHDLRLKFVPTPGTSIHPVWENLPIWGFHYKWWGLFLSHGPCLSLGLHSNGVSCLTLQDWSPCLGLPPSSTVPGISLLYPGPLLASMMPGSLCLLSHCMWSSCHTCRSFLMLTCPPRHLSCHSLLRICSLGPVGLKITSPITSTPVYDPIHCVLFLGHCLLAYLISFQEEKQLVMGRSRRTS